MSENEFRVVYTVSDKGSMVKETLNSIRTVRRFVEKENVIVFYTPPRSEVNLNKLSDLAVVVKKDNITKPFYFERNRFGRYGEKIHLCDVDCPTVIFLDGDTIVKKDIRELLRDEYDFSARVGTAYHDFNQYIWMNMFKRIKKEPIPMPNTGFMIFKDYTHKEIRDEWLRYINNPHLPNPHPECYLKEQYALALAISGKKIKWMSEKEHLFGWTSERDETIDSYVIHLGHNRRRNYKTENKTLKGIISVKTKKIRHAIVRIIAPRLYADAIRQPRSIKVRPMIHFIKRYLGFKPLVGIEIGVLYGHNAKSILETLNIKKLYLIDPYLPYTDRVFRDPRKALEEARSNLSRFENKVVWVLKESSDAINDVPDNLDFVYIDGNHAYEYVKKDIELYYHKVKEGGILGGHDYSIDFMGVVRAVNEFVKENDMFLYRDGYDWRTIKGAKFP